VVCCCRPADERLDEVGGVAAGGEGCAGDGGGIGEGPGGLFGGFDEDGGACEEGGYYGGQDVVDLIWVSIVD